MKWLLVDKSKTQQPGSGTYGDWKGIIRKEGKYQCVYCAIGEPRFGGLRNFHVEHYKPKKKFVDLVNRISNLFYICAICNSFKGSDWPADPEPDFSNAAYPDPSACDYSQILRVDENNLVLSDTVAGRYVIERLYLNRLQLVHARGLDETLAKILQLKDELVVYVRGADAVLQGRFAEVLADAIDLLARLQQVRPYEPGDVRR